MSDLSSNDNEGMGVPRFSPSSSNVTKQFHERLPWDFRNNLLRDRTRCTCCNQPRYQSEPC